MPLVWSIKSLRIKFNHKYLKVVKNNYRNINFFFTASLAVLINKFPRYYISKLKISYHYNIAGKFVYLNSIARACFI